MIDTLKRVCQLVNAGAVRNSDHGYDELAEDKIRVREVLDDLADAKVG